MKSGICPACGQDFLHLGQHIANKHPEIIDQAIKAAESGQASVTPTLGTSLPVQAAQNVQTRPNLMIRSYSEIIAQALNDIVAVQIIKALSSSNPPSLQDLGSIMNPPKQTQLSDVIDFHKKIYGDEHPMIETGNQWIDIAQQALPIIKDMMPKKKAEMMPNVRGDETANNDLPGGVFKEIAPSESKSDGHL